MREHHSAIFELPVLEHEREIIDAVLRGKTQSPLLVVGDQE